MKTYSKLSQSVLVATTIVLFVSAQAFAGHGGGGGHVGGGAGFHGGYGGGGEHYGGYGGGGEYRGGEVGNRGGGAVTNWSAAGHTPSYSTPHSNFNTTRSNLASSAWSHNAAHPGWGDHANAGGRTNYANHGQHPDWYHGNWNNHGDHYWHHWPAGWGWWGAGALAGALAGAELADLATPWSWGYLSYDNPYCSGPVVADGATIDYSQPIVLATAPATATQQGDEQWPVSTPTAPADEAAQWLDAARDAFTQGDYATALTQCDKAIAKTPNDTVPHEFRGLVLFALHRYKEAAASLYAVLSVGPGWDWTTMSSLYTDVNVYTEQLRDLEKYVNANPSSADARFVLAYHYLTCGHTDSAAAQFKAVVRLNPKDQLSAQILHALDTTDTAKQPATAAASSKPVKAATLVGNWKAKRADGKTIALNLSNDGKYTWTFAQNDKPQAFSGDYSVADNLLVLKQAGTPMMVGQVTPTAADGFNFKLPGDNPDDPGLTFGK